MATVYETTPFQYFALAASGTPASGSFDGGFGPISGFGGLGCVGGPPGTRALGCSNQGYVRADGVGSLDLSPAMGYGLFALGAAGLAAGIAYAVERKPGRYGRVAQSAAYQGGAVAALIGLSGGGLTPTERALFGGAGLALLAGSAYTALRR